MFWWKARFVSSNMTFQDMCLWLIKQWPCWTWKKMIKSKTFFPCLFSLSLWGFEWNVNTDVYVLRKNSIWLFVVNIHIFKFIFSPHPSSPLLSYFITKWRKKEWKSNKTNDLEQYIRFLFKWKQYCSGEV